MTAPDTLTAALVAEYGPTLDALTVTEALDVADRLRAIAAALRGSSPLDGHVADQLTEAATVLEHRAGVPQRHGLGATGSE